MFDIKGFFTRMFGKKEPAQVETQSPPETTKIEPSAVTTPLPVDVVPVVPVVPEVTKVADTSPAVVTNEAKPKRKPRRIRSTANPTTSRKPRSRKPEKPKSLP